MNSIQGQLRLLESAWRGQAFEPLLSLQGKEALPRIRDAVIADPSLGNYAVSAVMQALSEDVARAFLADLLARVPIENWPRLIGRPQFKLVPETRVLALLQSSKP